MVQNVDVCVVRHRFSESTASDWTAAAVAGKGVMWVAIGLLIGIAAGLGLAYAVTTAFADEGLSFAVPAGSLITLVVVATVAGVLAAILPARRASRLDPLTALAYE